MQSEHFQEFMRFGIWFVSNSIFNPLGIVWKLHASEDQKELLCQCHKHNKLFPFCFPHGTNDSLIGSVPFLVQQCCNTWVNDIIWLNAHKLPIDSQWSGRNIHRAFFCVSIKYLFPFCLKISNAFSLHKHEMWSTRSACVPSCKHVWLYTVPCYMYIF